MYCMELYTHKQSFAIIANTMYEVCIVRWCRPHLITCARTKDSLVHQVQISGPLPGILKRPMEEQLCHVIGNYCIAHVYASLDVGVMIG